MAVINAATATIALIISSASSLGFSPFCFLLMFITSRCFIVYIILYGRINVNRFLKDFQNILRVSTDCVGLFV